MLFLNCPYSRNNYYLCVYSSTTWGLHHHKRMSSLILLDCWEVRFPWSGYLFYVPCGNSAPTSVKNLKAVKKGRTKFRKRATQIVYVAGCFCMGGVLSRDSIHAHHVVHVAVLSWVLIPSGKLCIGGASAFWYLQVLH